jgi:hypothetical protein
VVAAGEVVEELATLGFDPFGEGEEGVAFAHVDGAELAGPVVDWPKRWRWMAWRWARS